MMTMAEAVLKMGEKKENYMVLGMDFDGTCVEHDYPDIGKDIGAVPVLKKVIASGNKIVLNTMRSGKCLDKAVKWFADKKIPLYGINNNPDQNTWTASPKVYAHKYVDDAALGTPLKNGHVDWVKMEKLLINEGFITEEEQ